MTRTGSGDCVDDEAELVERMTERLAEIGSSLGSLPPLATRRLIATFVSCAVVDLETRDLELDLSLLEWAVSGENALCLDATLSFKTDNKAHHVERQVFLASRLLWSPALRSLWAYDFGVAAWFCPTRTG